MSTARKLQPAVERARAHLQTLLAGAEPDPPIVEAAEALLARQLPAIPTSPVAWTCDVVSDGELATDWRTDAQVAAQHRENLLCELSTLIVNVANLHSVPNEHQDTHNSIVAAHRKHRREDKRHLLQHMRRQRERVRAADRSSLEEAIHAVDAVPEERLLQDRRCLLDAAGRWMKP